MLTPTDQPNFTAAILPRLGKFGPVVYGSAPDRTGVKKFLLTRLMGTLISLDPNWSHLKERRVPWRLEKDSLGRPFLTTGSDRGPAVSFSEVGGRLWAALAGAGQVGCDATQAQEFAGRYPLSRAFHAAEWTHAGSLCAGETGRTAALLWSLKEAAVKALGVGFHFVDPLELIVSPPIAWQGGLLFTVQAGPQLPTWARRTGPGWLAIALA